MCKGSKNDKWPIVIAFEKTNKHAYKKKMIIKLVIYKDQLQSQSSKQAIRRNCELFRCKTKKTISRSPNYKPCVGYKFYCKAKC